VTLAVPRMEPTHHAMVQPMKPSRAAIGQGSAKRCSVLPSCGGCRSMGKHPFDPEDDLRFNKNAVIQARRTSAEAKLGR